MKKRLLSLALCLALCLGLLPVGVLAANGESGGVYVSPSSQTEGGGGTYPPPEDTRAEIWRDTSRYQSISRSYDGTTDGSTIKVTFPFTDGSKEIQLEEGKDCEAVKTFDSADAGSRTVTVELKLIGEIHDWRQHQQGLSQADRVPFQDDLRSGRKAPAAVVCRWCSGRRRGNVLLLVFRI